MVFFIKAIFATLIVTLLSVGCTPKERYVTVEGYMLGTTFRIVAQTSASQSDIYSQAMHIDSVAKSSMSIFNPNSLISAVNDNRCDTLDIHLLRNMAVAADMHRLSGGAYDITVKPLTEAYGFVAKGRIEHPNIDSLLQFVGFDRFRINGNRVIKEDSRVQFDLNSLAKGYTVDMLADRLEAMGCCNYIVEIGGEIRAAGKNPLNSEWRVGVDTPFEGNQTPGEYQHSVVEISNRALATSGNYRRYHIDNQGNRITHTIDPKTGKSTSSSLLSATVITERCVVADAMATMFMAMGEERAVALAQSLKDKGVEAYFIIADKEGYKTFSTLKTISK
ncbi:MAG: FAD:protein FMN transferase [Alistipes sp.]|nr:FAD:protein FMN transferase [Alistipes sp.]